MRTKLKRGMWAAAVFIAVVLGAIWLFHDVAGSLLQRERSELGSGRKWALWASSETRLRGANIYQRRAYDSLNDVASLGVGVAGPPYRDHDFEALSAAGANLVVISHPGILTEAPPYHFDEPMAENLDRLVELAAAHGLSVVIAYRTGPGRSEFSILRSGAGDWFPEEMINDRVWSDATAQEGWCEMWRVTAKRYASHPAVVGFELMMEPNASTVFAEAGNLSPPDFLERHGQGAHDWNLLYPRLVSAVREVDASIPLLIPAEGYGSIYWLQYLKPVADPHCVYVVHHYVPSLYTHQSAEAYRPVRYPGMMGSSWVDEPLLGELNRRLHTYSRWHGVPVAVLEMGVSRWAPGAEQFLADQIDDFEGYGLNWAVWLWESTHTNYTRDVNTFNFRVGPNPATWQDSPSNALYRTIQHYWQRNATPLDR